MYNEAGMPIKYSPYLLVIHPSWKWMARRLIQTEKMPQSADNDVNPYNRDENSGMQYLTNPYITTANNWFVLSRDHGFDWYWRKKMQFKSSDDFNTGNAMFKSTGRWSIVNLDPRGAYGNPAS
jgi:hypothetical protein